MSKSEKPMTSAAKQKLIDEFNSRFAVGDTCEVRMDSGEVRPCTVKWEASMMGGHTPVAWLNEISGAYDLRRVNMNTLLARAGAKKGTEQ